MDTLRDRDSKLATLLHNAGLKIWLAAGFVGTLLPAVNKITVNTNLGI
jgi:hypothetical protein